MITVGQWTGYEAKQLRQALRLTVEAFAAQLGVSPRTVGKWEKRGRALTPLPETQAILDTALKQAAAADRERFRLAVSEARAAPDGAQTPGQAPAGGRDASPSVARLLVADRWSSDSGHALAEFIASAQPLDGDSALRVSQEWRIVEPPQVVELRTGRRVGNRLAEAVAERTETLRRMDDFLGGGDMHGLVRQELQATIHMVRDASYSETAGRRLLSVVGELCQLAGWVASDAGLNSAAERYYLGGVSAAHAADDQPLAANLLSSLSYQVANAGDARRAVLLATTAYQGAKSASATTRALLLERVAWANARLGDVQTTQRTLGEVDESFSQRNEADDPPFTYWLTQDEIDVMAGRCLTELKRPEQAVQLLTKAVAGYDETHERELALYLSWLAEAHIYGENIEEAVAIGERALRLATAGSSARSSARVRLLSHLLVPYAGNQAVDAFEEEVRTSLGQVTA